MTLYGPLTAEDFLRLFEKLAESSPDRPFFDAVLQAIVLELGAERGFLLRLRPSGAIQVLAAVSHEGLAIRRPTGAISQHALRRALRSETGVHHTNRALLDRRYRTEDVSEGPRRPRSIWVSVLKSPPDQDSDLALYLDHRFSDITISDHDRMSSAHWRALLEVGLRLHRNEKKIRRSEKELLRRSREETPAEEALIPASASRPVSPLERHGIWTRSSKMVELLETAIRVARSDIPIVVMGETGTGKGLLVNLIHESSRRCEAPFLSINCGAVPETLLESELFGHLRGAFTGAETDREGLLSQAEGGSLLLDEIGDMSLEMQKKLLRFLENGRFRPIGAKTERTGNVRILSATLRDLDAEVSAGRFRTDLYYRLCGIALRVPPLRERSEDAVGLAERFLDEIAADLQIEVPRLSGDARNWIPRQPWYGNIRELKNVMRQLAAMGVTRVDRGALSSLVRQTRGRVGIVRRGQPMEEVVAAAEKRAIEAALTESGGNKSKAAEILGITRKSLYRRLVKYNLIAVQNVEDETEDISFLFNRQTDSGEATL